MIMAVKMLNFLEKVNFLLLQVMINLSSFGMLIPGIAQKLYTLKRG
jgi:hypothetical protein